WVTLAGPVAGSVCPSISGAPNIRPRAPPPPASTIIGHEREVAVCLMQKCIDIAAEMQIRSAIALDHLKNYIYSEADKEKPMSEGENSQDRSQMMDGYIVTDSMKMTMTKKTRKRFLIQLL
nr:putative transcription elongation factor SPT5 homolog 1 [Tanacetum cinerariifolium]GFB52408.1 putative transcription elongation factor SPT5 homolog 1 [Tanacetum cinerariifolium]